MVEKKRKREALEQFPDGRRVRLRSRARAGMYLHADEDGKGVSLSPPLPASPLNAVWQVHRIERRGDTIVLLHGAAYGRYLAATRDSAPPGHLGHRVVQSVYGDDDKDAVCWTPRTVAAGDDHVILQDLDSSCRRFLRANGKYCRWRTGVTVGKYAHQDAMMHWVVETIPLMPLAPELPLPRPAAPPGSFWDKLFRRAAPVLERRNIRFVQAADDGSIDPDKNWGMMEFHGVSVFNLRSELAKQLSQEGNEDGIKLCVRAGNLGRMIPLITDLPRDGSPMDIIVLSTSAPNLPRGQENMDIVALTAGSPDATGSRDGDDVSDNMNGGMPADSLLTPAVISDLSENEAIGFIVHSVSIPDGVLSLQNPAADKNVPLPLGTEPGTKGDEFSDIPAAPEPKEREIQQQGGKGPSTAAVGDALGEHPGIGIVHARERMIDAYFLLDNAQEGLKRIEKKLQDKKEELRNNQELTKEQEQRLLKEVTKLKNDRNKQMVLCARLEQEAHAATEVLQREILRS